MAQHRVPVHPGLEWRGGSFPRECRAWPAAEAASSREDAPLHAIQQAVDWRTFEWPARVVHFLCDLHADAGALQRALILAGAIHKTGPDDDDDRLTPSGKAAKFVLGGDYFNKGPSNLRLLRALAVLRERGAALHFLAGNHDVSTLLGLRFAGRREPLLAPFFARMGTRSIPFLKEVLDTCVPPGVPLLSDAEARKFLLPAATWEGEFLRVVRGMLPEEAARAEIVRVREKAHALEAAALEHGMGLGRVHAAWRKAREMFFGPRGEFAWLAPALHLLHRDGSALFVHAGVDDTLAEWVARDGVEAVDRSFRAQLFRDPARVMQGPLGNALETRYKRADRPWTEEGAALLRCAGIQAVVHGHRNVPAGQRLRVRAGLLHLQCAVPVDATTRAEKGLPGTGGAVTTFFPVGRLVALCTDLPQARVLDGNALADLLAVA